MFEYIFPLILGFWIIGFLLLTLLRYNFLVNVITKIHFLPHAKQINYKDKLVDAI